MYYSALRQQIPCALMRKKWLLRGREKRTKKKTVWEKEERRNQKRQKWSSVLFVNCSLCRTVRFCIENFSTSKSFLTTSYSRSYFCPSRTVILLWYWVRTDFTLAVKIPSHLEKYSSFGRRGRYFVRRCYSTLLFPLPRNYNIRNGEYVCSSVLRVETLVYISLPTGSSGNARKQGQSVVWKAERRVSTSSKRCKCPCGSCGVSIDPTTNDNARPGRSWNSNGGNRCKNIESKVRLRVLRDQLSLVNQSVTD